MGRLWCLMAAVVLGLAVGCGHTPGPTSGDPDVKTTVMTNKDGSTEIITKASDEEPKK